VATFALVYRASMAFLALRVGRERQAVRDGLTMPKKKTNKAAAKRVKRTATGKLKYAKAGSGHLLSSKSRKRKRNLRGGGILSKPETTRLQGMIGS